MGSKQGVDDPRGMDNEDVNDRGKERNKQINEHKLTLFEHRTEHERDLFMHLLYNRPQVGTTVETHDKMPCSVSGPLAGS